MKAKDLILRILQTKTLPTTRLAKLCYIFDLASIQLQGQQKSDLPYKWWDHGPYCQEFARAVWELEEEGKIKREPYKTRTDNYDCILHLALDKKRPRLSKTDAELLDYVIDRFSRVDLNDLEKFVYSTPPMVEAQKKRHKYCPNFGVHYNVQHEIKSRSVWRSSKQRACPDGIEIKRRFST